MSAEPLRRHLARACPFAWILAACLGAGMLPASALAQANKPVEMTAQYAVPEGNQPARVAITAKIAKGWHIYSITQPKGGPIASEISVDASNEFKLAKEFTPDKPPKSKRDPLYKDLDVIEYHEGTVIWHAPLELTAGANPATIKVTGTFVYQACNDNSCLPPQRLKFTAALVAGAKLPIAPASQAGLEPSAAAPLAAPTLARSASEGKADAAAADVGTFTGKGPTANTTIRGFVQPKQAAAGETVTLTLIAEPNIAKHYHVYELRDKAPEKGSQPALIVLTESGNLKADRPRANSEPEIPSEAEARDGTIPFYSAPVTWTIRLQVPADAKPGPVKIAGLIGYQSCASGDACDQPSALRFTAEVMIDGAPLEGRAPLEFSRERYATVAALAAGSATAPAIEVAPAPPVPTIGPAVQAGTCIDLQKLEFSEAETPVALALLLALTGGVLLNFMPCVLPVIGLKVLSFVEQSGENRARAVWLNVWYSLGMLAVFMVLATLAIVLNLKWGQQFTFDEFNIALAAIVFVMGLSFLGVWEIPIPGFVGSSKVNQLAVKEGALGAFVKGAFTTILATPCSGPFLGATFGWAVRQPPYLTYAVFACISLGMSSPYLLIGAFPGLVRYLPRPGGWMETFKQAMGFMLLGTVVYLFTIISWIYVIPTLALLIGLWASCWWIGRTPITADTQTRFRAWAFAAAISLCVGGFAFSKLSEVMTERFESAVVREIAARNKSGPAAVAHNNNLPWEPYSLEALDRNICAGKTVLVDFTADWCPNCKYVEKVSLNTAATRKLVQENGVVTLVADWTRPSDEIEQILGQLRSESIPVTAIFPAHDPQRPVILRDVYFQDNLLDALRLAGPSRSPRAATTAMRSK